jgi:octaprenyl-diphosphate synthase
VAVELVHTASLLHDDIIDGTELRRGHPALHATQGAKAATFVGAHLLYVAGRLVQNLEVPSRPIYDEVRAAFARAASDACAGQLQEVSHLGDVALDETFYRSIVERKTARLFEVACEVGTLLSGAPRQPLTTYARQFGVLYQIVDDARDLFENQQNLKRLPGSDVLNGVYTLPLILALRGSDQHAAVIEHILRGRSGTLSPEEVGQLRQAVAASEAPTVILMRAREVGELALGATAELRHTTASDPMRRTIEHMLAYLDELFRSARAEAGYHAL